MRSLALGILFVVAVPASAVAAPRYYVPPGNSSADQYVESIPTAGGNGTSGRIAPRTSRGNRARGTVLSPSVESALQRVGTDGIQAATFADATGSLPTDAAKPHLRQGSVVRTPVSDSSEIRGASTGGYPAVGPVVRSLFGLSRGGGTFGVLVAVLILGTVGIGSVALRRRLGRAAT
jgi:hypothetical protein